MKAWGLDIGSAGIKAIKLAHSWRGSQVVSYGFYPFREQLNLEEEKKQILDKIFSSREKGETIFLSFPSQRTMVHRLSLPFAERKKNEQVLKFEVEPFLPLPAEEVIADFFPQPNFRQKKEALVFAASKSDLREYLSFVPEVGIDPESLIPEAVSLFWLVGFLKKIDNPGALLDLGVEKGTLIIWQDRGLTLARSLAVAAAPDVDYCRRLSAEIQRTLMAYESHGENEEVEKIWLTGGLANRLGLRERLAEVLGRKIDLLDLTIGFPSLKEEVPASYHHSLAVALGSALGAVVPAAERLNLRREELASARKLERERSRLSILTTYGTILALLALAALGIDYYLKESRYRELKNQIRLEFLQANPGAKKIVHEVQQMRNLVQEEKKRTGAWAGMDKDVSPLEVIFAISSAVAPTWKVRITELTMEGETVEISGEADSFETANRLKDLLDNSHLFKEGQLKVARVSTLENVVEFKIQMKKEIK
ncbi:MAG: PilN domain-containing protein [Thermodesulfobacteriota bacterium]